jgi:hypothetical protein
MTGATEQSLDASAATLEELAAFPLLEALYGRRSRRFALGGAMAHRPAGDRRRFRNQPVRAQRPRRHRSCPAGARRRGYAASHPNVGRALHYLADAQTPSGGFPLMGGGPANAESTAYALQGLVATAAVAATAHGERDPIFARCRLRMAAFASRRVAAPTRCG